jgi:hypothetical protein
MKTYNITISTLALLMAYSVIGTAGITAGSTLLALMLLSTGAYLFTKGVQS